MTFPVESARHSVSAASPGSQQAIEYAGNAQTSSLALPLRPFFPDPSGMIARFFAAQVHLYRHDLALQDYFLQLQLTAAAGSAHHAPRRRLRDAAFFRQLLHTAGRMRSAPLRRPIKADILFCPMPNFSRVTENRFLARTLLGLTETGATVACLLAADAPVRYELESRLASLGRRGQVVFVDPLQTLGPLGRRLCSEVARSRASQVLRSMQEILTPHGLEPLLPLEGQLDHLAVYVEAWQRLAPLLECNAVVARCHWQTLCSPVCRTGMERGVPVLTFQQGVIGHTLDVPVTASHFVAFGATSASFLDRLNQGFFTALGAPSPCPAFIPGGCLYDTILGLPDQYDRHTVLVVDVPQPPGQSEFYGIQQQCVSLLEISRRLLATLPAVRVIIRPHPFWGNLDMEECQRLARDYPDRCELSHPAWSLEDDLRRSSAALGIFSGALTVAATSGIPTIFLEGNEGCLTGDLACFAPEQMLPPDAAFRKLADILQDRALYTAARSVALAQAREYYCDGANLKLDGAFFGTVLQSRPSAAQV